MKNNKTEELINRLDSNRVQCFQCQKYLQKIAENEFYIYKASIYLCDKCKRKTGLANFKDRSKWIK